MRDIIILTKRFVPPYKKDVILNLIFNILGSFLSIFSFIFIIPILRVLFKMEEASYEFIAWNSPDISFTDTIKNNFYWYVGDLMSTQGEGTTLAILGIFLVIATLLKTGSAYLSSFFMLNLRTGVVRDIRNEINDKILSLPLSFYSSERKGDIMARITGDVGEVENSIMCSLDMMIKNPIMIVVCLSTMFNTSWQLTCFVLILLPFMAYFMGLIGKKLKSSSVLAQSKWGDLISQSEETLGGLRVIKAFNAEQTMSDRFKRESNIFRRLSIKIGRRQQLAHPLSELLGTLTIAIILWYGGSLIIAGEGSLDAATFIFYLLVFYSIINPAKELSKASYAIQRGMASMDRVDKILSAENNITDPTNPKELIFQNKIEYKDVWFKYKERWVVKGVDLTVQKGQKVALVGESGSGKSTMVDLLPRFYDVEKGEIFIDGISIKDVRVYDLRSIMGNVNQEAILFNDTFFNNISFGVKECTYDEVVAAAKIANAHDFIMETADGYNTNIGDRGGKLSGGQRQRVSIARAILRNPPILILDEATSALDTSSERLVQEALENLMRNRTTIVIAHRLSTIVNSDLICVMHDGEIIERGTHESLYAKGGNYRRLCDMQIES